MSNTPTILIDVSLSREDFQLTVHLNLPAKGITGLFGHSGSGKTTLLRCVAGLESSSGIIRIGDDVWQDTSQGLFVPTWQRDLGMVFQEASLFEHLSVKQNMEYGMTRVRKPGGQKSLDAAIELLGIGHLLNRAPGSLSGGERQRVAIARALATQPRLLLLDEPLASLDIPRKKEILPWLDRLHAELSIPVMYVTHSVEEISRLADDVVTLENGHVSDTGPVADLLPKIRETAWL